MSVIDIFIRIGNRTSDIGVVGGKGSEGGGSIWLAGVGGTTFAWGGFSLTRELELEADSGGLAAFDVEDR